LVVVVRVWLCDRSEIGQQSVGLRKASPLGRSARILGMATREQAHKLLDGLAESEIDPVVEFIASRGENGAGAEEAKPGDIVDEWGNLAAMKRRSSARTMKRLSEEEIAANGETLAEAWGYEPKHPR
jgi:hypothetical protein